MLAIFPEEAKDKAIAVENRVCFIIDDAAGPENRW